MKSQNEYDELKQQIHELKEQINRLKHYVDYQNKKMRSFGQGDICKVLMIVFGNSVKSSEYDENWILTEQRKTCHKINLEMLEKGIITQESITENIVSKDGRVDLRPTLSPNLKQN